MIEKDSGLEVGKSDDIKISDSSSAVCALSRLMLALRDFKANSESLGAMLGRGTFFERGLPLFKGESAASKVSRIRCAAARRLSANAGSTGSSEAAYKT